MGDERLRELERRFTATGTAEDGAAWLLERVRTGELTRTRLEAALCGHPGALLATGRDPPPDFARDIKDDTTQRGDPMWWGVNEWGRALWAVDSTIAIRAGWLAASATLHHWTALHPQIVEPRRTLDHVAAWLAAPSDEGVVQAVRSALEAELSVSRTPLPDYAHSGRLAGFAGAYSGMCLSEAGKVPQRPIEAHGRGGGVAFLYLLDAVADSEGTPARVLPLVQRELLAWALEPR